MKKILTVLLISVMVLTAGCSQREINPPETEPAVSFDPEANSEGVMTYEEFVAAKNNDEVVIEAYVQAKESWWDDKASIYAQNPAGGYFIYNMACSEEDYEKLVPGTKIKVTGTKSEYRGETEISHGVFEIVEDGSWLAEARDVTELLNDEAQLRECINQLVVFKGLTVTGRTDENGNEAAFQYRTDGSGSHDSNSDLYFDAVLGEKKITFMVESYLCDNTTDVYRAVENLKVGDIVDVECFLYFQKEGDNLLNPHVTSVTVNPGE